MQTLRSAEPRLAAERSPALPDVSFPGAIPAFPGKALAPRGGTLTLSTGEEREI